MNLRGLSKLCCPMCKGTLSVSSFQEEKAEINENDLINTEEKRELLETVIKEGVLLCENCKVWYPVSSYVPVMLVFKIPFHEFFFKSHQKKFSKYSEYSAPKWEPRPGERSVQETFTEEWNTVLDSQLSFTYTKDELNLLHKKVWLKWPEKAPANVKLILNVGCGGLGAEAGALYEISKAEVFGIDLNLALLNTAHRFVNRPFIHIVIASLFYLPFPEKSFDLVYSQGVLHHTYSTYEAFKSISMFVREGGEIFIWVYALEDHLVPKGYLGAIKQFQYAVENLLLRPTISRLPASLRATAIYLLSALVHPLMLGMLVRNQGIWELKNTQHWMRDWLTPRYAYRHSFNEVIEWFEGLGFTYDLQSAATYRKFFGDRMRGVGVLGKKISV